MSGNMCNGYTNWDTWIVALYSDNERLFNNMKQNMYLNMYRRVTSISKIKAFMFATNYGLVSYCARKEPEFDPTLVDWTDIADTWTTELEEYRQYNA